MKSNKKTMLYSIDTQNFTNQDTFVLLCHIFADYPELLEVLGKRLSYETEQGLQELYDSFLLTNTEIAEGRIDNAQEYELVKNYYIASTSYIRGIESYQELAKKQAQEQQDRNKDQDDALASIHQL